MSVLRIDPAHYVRHAIHLSERVWPETNCYVDLWIELLHALELDPYAMLAFTLGVDFEGDQFTFYKPSHTDLCSLYGIKVEELNVWRDLQPQVIEQLERGRLVVAEVDAFFLPDTAGTDYRQQHTKTTIAIEHLTETELHYFHNAGFHVLGGDDVRGLLQTRELPLLPELVKLDRMLQRSPGELRALAVPILQRTLAFRPVNNPFTAFAARLDKDNVTRHGLAYWHQYAFATVRQCGSAFELARDFLRWWDPALDSVARDCEQIAIHSKTLILRGARAANRQQALDANETLAAMARHWQSLMSTLVARLT